MAAATDIGIDLGTATILVYVKGKGITVKEPAVVAYDKDLDKIKAYGEEARQMIGRTPGNIMAIHPLREGSITDYVITERMLRYFIQKAMGRRGLRKPRIVICVPSGVTDVERRAVEQATYQAGARDVVIVPEPIAAAVGAGIDIARPCGNMIVDIGGGITDVAVISLGGIVVSDSIQQGGSSFNESIIRYVRKVHGLFIGEQTAESLKIKIGTVHQKGKDKVMEIRGRNVVTGLPKTVMISSAEIRAAGSDVVTQIVELIQSVLEKTPPELAADVARRGIVLTGGGALLDGIEDVIRDRTGINTLIAENPMSVVALGTGRYVEVMNSFERRN